MSHEYYEAKPGWRCLTVMRLFDDFFSLSSLVSLDICVGFFSSLFVSSPPLLHHGGFGTDNSGHFWLVPFQRRQGVIIYQGGMEAEHKGPSYRIVSYRIVCIAIRPDNG